MRILFYPALGERQVDELMPGIGVCLLFSFFFFLFFLFLRMDNSDGHVFGFRHTQILNALLF